MTVPAGQQSVETAIPSAGAARSGEKGVALIMVLWTVAVIAVIGFVFSSSARVEVMSATAYGDRVAGRFAAEAGVRRAIAEILYARTKADDAWSLEGAPSDGSLAAGSFRVRIVPEESRIDINRSNPRLLRNLFLVLGLDEDEADAAVDAVQDWRDPDNLVRPFGAEDAYYGSLEPPYSPRNADFETIDEIRLVRGITAELWEGSEGRKGLRDLVTVYSPSGKIDPNTAPREILASLEDMTETSVEEIIALRGDDSLPPASALSRARELTPGSANALSTASGRTFRIFATALRQGKASTIGVEAVVTLKGNSADIVYWNSRSRLETAGEREPGNDDAERPAG